MHVCVGVMGRLTSQLENPRFKEQFVAFLWVLQFVRLIGDSKLAISVAVSVNVCLFAFPLQWIGDLSRASYNSV